MYQLVIEIYKNEFLHEIQEKMKLDIQTIFKCFNSVTFLREVPPVTYLQQFLTLVHE